MKQNYLDLDLRVLLSECFHCSWFKNAIMSENKQRISYFIINRNNIGIHA